MFSTFLKTNLDFSVTFILWSASAFSLDQSENLSFGKGLSRLLSVAQWSFTDSLDRD